MLYFSAIGLAGTVLVHYWTTRFRNWQSRHARMDADVAFENLARLVQVIGRDPKLRGWFCGLVKKSPVQRTNAIHIMAERMAADRKDADLIACFRLLADARVLEATRLALRECGSIKD